MEPKKLSENKTMLNAAQKRSLTIALRLIEERLFDLQLTLKHRSYQGILFRLEIDLSEEQISLISDNIENIFRIIRRLKKDFHLQAEKKMFSSSILGTSSYFWTILEDEKAKKLVRYGSVHPQLSERLDPSLETLTSALYELARLAGVKGTNFESGKSE